MDIFITGCAKTRTTLIHWLFSAFEGCIIIPSESPVWVFRHNLLHYLYPDDVHLVAKRMYGSILCGTKLYEENYKDQISRILSDDVKIVSVRRNYKDTLKSENGYVPPERYKIWEKERKILDSLIAVEIDSDNVISNPDVEQQKVADALGLKIAHRWSEWPKFAPKSQMQYIDYPKFFNRLGGGNDNR